MDLQQQGKWHKKTCLHASNRILMDHLYLYQAWIYGKLCPYVFDIWTRAWFVNCWQYLTSHKGTYAKPQYNAERFVILCCWLALREFGLSDSSPQRTLRDFLYAKRFALISRFIQLSWLVANWETSQRRMPWRSCSSIEVTTPRNSFGIWSELIVCCKSWCNCISMTTNNSQFEWSSRATQHDITWIEECI